MHFTAYINWGVDRARPLLSIPVPWNSPSLRFRVSLSSLQNMQILLPNTLCLADFFLIFTTSAIGRWGRREQRGPHLICQWFTSLFLHHCSYSNTLSLAATVVASSFPFEWSPRHWSALCALCGVAVSCLLNCYINEIELSHFLDFHTSTPSLSSPLMSTVWNRQRGICSLLGGWVIAPAWGWKYSNWLQTRCNMIMGPQAWKNLLQSTSCPRAVSENFVILGKRLCSWLLFISALVWCRIFICIEESIFFSRLPAYSYSYVEF